MSESTVPAAHRNPTLRYALLAAQAVLVISFIVCFTVLDSVPVALVLMGAYGLVSIIHRRAEGISLGRGSLARVGEGFSIVLSLGVAGLGLWNLVA